MYVQDQESTQGHRFSDKIDTERSESGLDQAAMKTFESAVSQGLYLRDADGLEGKHDNVRKHWEDQITRHSLHEFVGRLADRKRNALSRVRVLDLGAGSGEGYEILMSLRQSRNGLSGKDTEILPAEMLSCYRGLDISEAMVQQGNQIYSSDPKVHFQVGDLSQGLGTVSEEEPFDIYFSSYGSLSHLPDEDLKNLIEDVIDHASDSCIFVADLLGRYSFEWQCYWECSGEDSSNMRQYSMSWLYPPEMVSLIEQQRFPVRYWGGEEFHQFMCSIVENKGARIAEHRLRDRSILVGRHMNTGEFNPHAQPIRLAVNSLLQFNRRTELESLIFDYVPHDGFPELNSFFEKMHVVWNALVYASIEALDHWEDDEWLRAMPAIDYPQPVKDAVRTIRSVVKNAQSFRMGDVRANIIEPQLGYLLRNLEVELGAGLGRRPRASGDLRDRKVTYGTRSNSRKTIALQRSLFDQLLLLTGMVTYIAWNG